MNRTARILTFLIFSSTLFLPSVNDAQAARLFSDVLPENQYFEAVSELQQRGILNGFEDGTFRPYENISRAAALKVILLSSGTEVTGVAVTQPFPDVPTDAWYAAIAKKGRDLGIVKGDATGNFLPARNVSRAEALAMLYRTSGKTPSEVSTQPFSDVPLDAWYAPYFAEAKQQGLFTGDPAMPDKAITRGELSDITYLFFRDVWESSELVGIASYYGGGFEGAGTASGERFSNAEYMAAHRTLPFGTRLRVINPESLNSVVVRVSDRGPYVEGRVIDLSQAAFSVLAPLSRGVTDVQLEVVPESTPLGPPENCVPELSGKLISSDFYDGIELFADLRTEFRVGEVATISGEIKNPDKFDTVSIYYGPESARKVFSQKASGTVFSIPVVFPEAGTFNFSILPGKSGTAKSKEISVLAPNCEPNTAARATPAKDLRYEIKAGETVFYWKDRVNDLFRIQLEQDKKTTDFYVYGDTKLTVPLQQLKNFSEGQAVVKIWSAKTKGNIFKRKTGWEYGGEIKLFLTDHISRHFNRLPEVDLTEQFALGETITLKGKTEKNLDPKVIIIDPDEEIIERDLVMDSGEFSFTFKPEKPGTHIFEINQADALTLFVGATVLEGTVPLLPDFFDLNEPEQFIEISEMPNLMKNYINTERIIRKLPQLELDSDLTDLAQFRAEDMCEREYFSHIDPEGKSAEDYRVMHNVKTVVGENIAKDTSVRTSHENLMRSPAHRKLIIDPSYSRIGLGFCHNDNDPNVLTVVQIFSGDTFSEANIPTIRENILKEVNSIRNENPIVPNVVLEGVAQQWSQKMIDKNFWGFQHQNDTLEKSLRSAGVTNAAHGIVLKLGSITDLQGAFVKKDISIGGTNEENFLLNTDFRKMGVGIVQNEAWEIYVVILAT